jgi:rare lipoprotein A
MKKIFLILAVLFVTVFYFPYRVQAQSAEIFRQEGIASWYGKEFEGRPTASGEIFDSSKLTAAHPSLPFGTMLVVTNQHNNKKVTVRVNDRGPFVAARIVDISKAAAEQLDMIVTGTAPVLIESIDKVVMPTPAIEQNTMSTNTPVTQNAPPVQPVYQPVASTVSVSQPVVQPVAAQAVVTQLTQLKLIPQMNIISDKKYRLQVGSYKVARNAVEAFDKLKNSGLSPAYERFIDNKNDEYFRVVLAGISGNDIQLTAERLITAGFREALIREEK